MQRGASLPRLGDFNQRVVLDCIRRSSEGITRVELASMTGLSTQTISNVTKRLLRSKLVVEVGRHSVGPGKPATVLGLNRRGMFSVGVHIDPARVDVVLLDLGGEVAGNMSDWMPLDADPDVVLDIVSNAIERLLAEQDISSQLVVGIGLAVPGPLDMGRGLMINPPLLLRWREVPIRDRLSERMGLRVDLVKDVTAAAIGEAWLTEGSRPRDLLYVYWGTGIGIGLVHRGEGWHGVTANFGEIGHLVVSERDHRCRCCGMRGTLGQAVSVRTIAQRTEDAGLASGTGTPASDCDALSLLAKAAEAGDERATAIVDDLLSDLVVGISRFTDLLDVPTVVVGGHVWGHFERAMLEPLTTALAQRPVLTSARRVEVQSSERADGVVAVGAASLVLDELLSPRANDMLSQQADAGVEAVEESVG